MEYQERYKFLKAKTHPYVEWSTFEIIDQNQELVIGQTNSLETATLITDALNSYEDSGYETL